MKVIYQQGAIGPAGATGPAGLSNYQIWINNGNVGTIEDFFESQKGDTGEGVPTGGITGQILSKTDSTDYNTQWTDLSGLINLNADDIDDASTINKFVTSAEKTKLSNILGVNTGDQDLSSYVTTSTLTTSLDTKANSSHNHIISNITGLQAILDDKQPLSSILTNTTASFTTILETKLNGIQIGAEVNVNADWNAITGDAQILNKPSTFTPSSHTHASSDITDFQSNVSNNTDVLTNTAVRHTHANLGALDSVSGINTGDNAINNLYSGLSTSKQDVLISSTNIKTINGNTILGSGDIEIVSESSGDVVGPATSTDEAVARFDGATGKILQNSTVKITDNGSLILPENSLPTPAGANEIKLFARQISGRIMPAFVGPSGLDSILQPLLAKNKVGYWSPPGNATTVPGVFGFTAPTITGFTAAARNVATTNMFTRMRRLGYNTAATAGAVGHWRHAANQFSLGDGTGLGGFTYIIRFGISDAAAVAGARMFMGMRVTAVPTNVEPSTLTNCIGIGHRAADTNMHIFFGGSSAQTPVDLGVNFPANTRNVDVYELALFASPNTANTINWTVTRLNTGNVASGTVTGAATVIPQSTLLIAPWGYRTNNATALAVGLDIMSVYIETDL